MISSHLKKCSSLKKGFEGKTLKVDTCICIYIYTHVYTNLYEIRNLKSMALEGIEEFLEIWFEIFFFLIAVEL